MQRPPHNSRIYILLNAHGTFFRTDHMLGHKTSFNSFLGFFFFFHLNHPNHHTGMKLETNNRKESWKNHKYLEIRQKTLKQSVGQRRNHKGDKVRKYFDTLKTKIRHTQTSRTQQ